MVVNDAGPMYLGPVARVPESARAPGAFFSILAQFALPNAAPTSRPRALTRINAEAGRLVHASWGAPESRRGMFHY